MSIMVDVLTSLCYADADSELHRQSLTSVLSCHQHRRLIPLRRLLMQVAVNRNSEFSHSQLGIICHFLEGLGNAFQQRGDFLSDASLFWSLTCLPPSLLSLLILLFSFWLYSSLCALRHQSIFGPFTSDVFGTCGHSQLAGSAASPCH